MHKLETIEIKNFKSIRDVKIEYCKRVNIFIGYPNVGKSNILEAIGLFGLLEAKEGNRIELKDLVRFNNLSQLFFNGDFSSKIEITINNFFVTEIKHLNVGCSFRIFSRKKEKSTIGPIVPQSKVEKTEINLLTGHLNDPFLSEMKEGSVNNNVWATKIDPIKRYSFIPNPIFKTTASLNYLSIPSGDNISKIIFSIPDVKKEVIELLKKDRLSIANSMDSKGGLKVLKTLNDGSHFILDYEMIADTLQRLIFHKTAITSNKDSVLLFEEPESHVFPPYISKLTNDVIYDENRNQFFITTHSPFVLNDLMDNLKDDELAIYIVSYFNETGETNIQRMSKEDMHDAYQFGYDFFMNIDKFTSQIQHE